MKRFQIRIAVFSVWCIR